MNKVVRLLSVLALSASVALWSCEGEQGPQGLQGATGSAGKDGAAGKDGTNGTNGTNGKDGNMNVVSKEVTIQASEWKATEVPGIGTVSTSTWGYKGVEDAAITANKYVLAYVKTTSTGGSSWMALPLSYSKEINASIEQLNSSYRTGMVELYYRTQTQLFGGSSKYAPDNAITVKYVIIENVLGKTMEANGVNLKNYNEVVNYLNAH